MVFLYLRLRQLELWSSGSGGISRVGWRSCLWAIFRFLSAVPLCLRRVHFKTCMACQLLLRIRLPECVGRSIRWPKIHCSALSCSLSWMLFRYTLNSSSRQFLVFTRHDGKGILLRATIYLHYLPHTWDDYWICCGACHGDVLRTSSPLQFERSHFTAAVQPFFITWSSHLRNRRLHLGGIGNRNSAMERAKQVEKKSAALPVKKQYRIAQVGVADRSSRRRGVVSLRIT